MALIDDAFTDMQKLKLWFRLLQRENLKMSDIPELIPLRWTLFRDQWDFLVDDITNLVDQYSDPDRFRTQLLEFTRFIETERVAGNKNSNPFSDDTIFRRFYAVWDNIDISIAQTSRLESEIIEDKINEISAYTKTDFLAIRDTLSRARDNIADSTGSNDTDYDTTFNRSPVVAVREIKVSDVLDMQEIMNGIKALDFILANISGVETTTIDPFALAKSNANNDLIEIDSYKSATMVRMRFGETLQSLANRFLGDSDKWQDIAIANGLRAPFVDEIGQSLPLIANGDENRINLSGTTPGGEVTINTLYVGQPVFLESSTLSIREQRLIKNIKEVPVSGELVLELSGEKDLAKLQIADNASIRVFKPNTINSNFFVAIPSVDDAPTTLGNDTPFFLAAAAEDEKIAAVDLSVDGDGDLAFTSFGDLRLSYGLENAIQAVQLKIANEAGQLARHPEFGLISLYGQKQSNSAAIKSALITSITGMIDADSRFDRIETIDVQQNTGGPSGYVMRLIVRMAGAGTLVPISFSVNVG